MEDILTERDMLGDSLVTEKEMAETCAVFVSESTSQTLRNEMTKIFAESQQLQFEMLNHMKARGWHDVRNADSGDIRETVRKYREIMSSL